MTTDLESVTCICGAPMTLRTTTKLKTKDGQPKKFWGCTRYPACQEIHGAHQATGKPLGKPADKETRQARIVAHAAFDWLWKNGPMTRTEAYRWLALQFIPKTARAKNPKLDIHISEMDKEQCGRVESICRNYREKREKKISRKSLPPVGLPTVRRRSE